MAVTTDREVPLRPTPQSLTPPSRKVTVQAGDQASGPAPRPAGSRTLSSDRGPAPGGGTKAARLPTRTVVRFEACSVSSPASGREGFGAASGGRGSRSNSLRSAGPAGVGVAQVPRAEEEGSASETTTIMTGVSGRAHRAGCDGVPASAARMCAEVCPPIMLPRCRHISHVALEYAKSLAIAAGWRGEEAVSLRGGPGSLRIALRLTCFSPPRAFATNHERRRS